MFLYNVTVGIDKEVETEWIAWIKEQHIPKIMNTGYFLESKLYKVVSQEDENSVSYCIQLFSDKIEKIVEYLDKHTNTIIEEHRQKFKDRHVAFNTLLEEI
jgi:S-adenosylmethionine:tRNA-ribosyltransferase-isomerase (queuine synthetase)